MFVHKIEIGGVVVYLSPEECSAVAEACHVATGSDSAKQDVWDTLHGAFTALAAIGVCTSYMQSDHLRLARASIAEMGIAVRDQG
ncbi:MAG TPA: hypothetical protein VMY40_15625 [Anaerolineae bacterium]|nr:hypothetical protein [Anaerolineae bacterium]